MPPLGCDETITKKAAACTTKALAGHPKADSVVPLVAGPAITDGGVLVRVLPHCPHLGPVGGELEPVAPTVFVEAAAAHQCDILDWQGQELRDVVDLEVPR